MELRPNDKNVTAKQPPQPVAAPSRPDPTLHTDPPTSLETTDPIQPVAEQPTPTQEPTSKPRGYAWRGFMSLIQLVVGAVVLAFIINHLVFQSYQVYGHSMVPTLHEGDRLIINKLGKSFSGVFGDGYLPKRGEIIVFHNPKDPQVQLVKRVVGLPGDRVVVESGEIFVFTPGEPDGFDFDQTFGLNLETTVGSVDFEVPPGEVFVVGDNRTSGGSLDSRNELGTVPIRQIVGELVVRIFPFNDLKTF